MTTSEIMLLESLKDNPELNGISGGIDLHVREETSEETSSSTNMSGCLSKNNTETSSNTTMTDSPSTSTSVSIPNSVKSSCSKSTKRTKEDQEDDIYKLVAKKIKLEIEELQERIEHNQVLFELKKNMLDMEVKKLLNENLLDMQGMIPLQLASFRLFPVTEWHLNH